VTSPLDSAKHSDNTTTDTRLRLVLLRHAKSAWPEVADHERPLAPRGRRDAPAAGRWLREHGYLPDLVVCSPARRTRETWQLAAPQLPLTPRVDLSPEAYPGDATRLATLVRRTPTAVHTLLLIGHNPGIQDLLLTLAADSGDDALERARTKFPTAGIAVLELAGPWTQLRDHGARLTEFAVPRG